MKTKTTTLRSALGVIALLGLGFTANAQNTTLDADMIPLPAGSNNAIMGGGNMTGNISGGANTSIGWFAQNMLTTGNANVAVGYGALVQNNNDLNVSVGVKSQNGNINGHDNTSIGSYALNNNDGKYNSALGSQADLSFNGFGLATAIGAFAICNNNSRVWLGDASSDVWTMNSYNVSDGRFKRNIDASKVKGLDFIKLLRPVTYTFDGRALTEHMSKNLSEESRKAHIDRDFSKSDNVVRTGFIAQEVEQAAIKSGYSFSGVHSPEGETDTYGIAYQEFVVPLVKAVQEQQEMIDALKTLTQQQQQQIADLQSAVAKASGATGIGHINADGSLSMSQNEPNPFATETVVKYNLSENTNQAYMAVYDLSGKQLNTFAITQKGNSSITLTSDKLAPGIYIYSIIADGKVVDSKRMVVSGK